MRWGAIALNPALNQGCRILPQNWMAIASLQKRDEKETRSPLR
ncbi:hypothetical protein PN441_05905 [Spirulina major CS-329]|nr:hypothetical protein [Spirulina subsalsa]MDB9502601.1 hypothetical protein [Spirulina major CS-329]